MIILTCNWCGNKVEMILGIENNYGNVHPGLVGDDAINSNNGWHIDTMVRDYYKIGDDLCPSCKKVFDERKKIAHYNADAIMREAVAKAKEAKKKLVQEARDNAKQSRVGRLERDSIMREKQRQRAVDNAD